MTDGAGAVAMAANRNIFALIPNSQFWDQAKSVILIESTRLDFPLSVAVILAS